MPIAINQETPTKPQWLETLQRDGYVVVPGVLPADKALNYADKAYGWVEDFGLGYKRDDPSTRTLDKLHFFAKGGLTNRYGVAHEQFIWDIKQEPALIEKFEQIWGTKELLVSFDGMNVSIPVIGRSEDDDVFKPWAHVDQSPLIPDLYCVQGIMNLVPNGPDDGGLMVLKGSAALYSQLFDAFDDVKPERGWNKIDRHNHTPEQLQWFYDNGCEWHKVCAQPGDLLLWDSRTVHYGATPSAQSDRVAVLPSLTWQTAATNRPSRQDAWEKKLNSSHDPVSFWRVQREVPEDHPTHAINVARPLQEPVLTARGRQLIGLDPY
ncbi:hypothetical protein JCM24511_07386 [Saitozyma sp. JCM 24511]|nr:hypothetical protein JCM24511_07386 [Saitozyma sp. JCM 24511]